MKYKIYTDGATSGNGYEGAQGGWAWILLDENETFLATNMCHEDNVTNNYCELRAVIDACRFFELNEKGKDCIVYSDSAYIINCCKAKWYRNWQINGWLNSKKQPVANKELWKKLVPYFENPHFSFEKVAGHADNKYNNLVDEMAVKAKFMKDVSEIWQM